MSYTAKSIAKIRSLLVSTNVSNHHVLTGQATNLADHLQCEYLHIYQEYSTDQTDDFLFRTNVNLNRAIDSFRSRCYSPSTELSAKMVDDFVADVLEAIVKIEWHFDRTT